MTKNKTKIYFWLKLDNNFFRNLAIKQLRRMSGGDTYIIIYQKMMLQSLENQGYIYFEGVLDTLAEEIAMTLDEKVEDVQMTIAYFQNKNLLQIGEDNKIFLEQVPMLLDQETNWNRYKRQKNKKLENFQPVSNHLPTDIEKEIEHKSKNKNKSKNQNKNNATADFSEIYSYYQQEIGVLSPNQAEQLADYLKLDNFEPELLKRAIDKASNNAKRSFGYVNSILRNWRQNGITTLVQAEEEDRKFHESKQQPAKSDIESTIPDLPF